MPSTPRSLVRLNSRAWSVSTGASSSSPSSDQVPDDRIAAFSLRSGAATKADAVSWLATACTGASIPWCASIGPSVVPASTGSPANGAAGSPSRSISPRAHVPARASSRPVVDALVTSLASSPLSQYDEQVGHERDPLGGRAPRLVGEQLEDRVDRHRLDAGDRVELARGHARVRARDHPLGARVAVVERQPEHAAVAVEQRVVDAPGVDADAAQRRVEPRAARRAPR